MIKSMTGFASASVKGKDVVLHGTISVLNSQGLNIYIKVPDILEEAEIILRRKISRKIKRGAVNVKIIIEKFPNRELLRINHERIEYYLKDFSQLTAKGININLSDILRLPGVVEGISDEFKKICIKKMEKLTEDLLKKVDQMRIKEGAVIHKFLKETSKKLENSVKKINKEVNKSPRKLREKIYKRLMELFPDLGNTVRTEVIKEASIIAQRTDITEELLRIGSHLEQMRETMEKEDTPGKKLGFILQELLREINTIGAKTNDIFISGQVITAKNYIEKMREQVNNIE